MDDALKYLMKDRRWCFQTRWAYIFILLFGIILALTLQIVATSTRNMS